MRSIMVRTREGYPLARIVESSVLGEHWTVPAPTSGEHPTSVVASLVRAHMLAQDDAAIRFLLAAAERRIRACQDATLLVSRIGDADAVP